MSKMKTLSEFKEEIKTIFGDNVEILGEYKGNKIKILVKYKDCGHSEYKVPSKLLAKQGCGKCKGKSISKAKTKSVERYKSDLLLNGIDYINVISEYRGISKKIKVCNKNCGHVYEAQAGNVLRGSGCPICHGNKTTESFISEINYKYPNEYEVIGEYINNRTPILVRHKCGYEWKVIPKDLLRDIRCPKCIMSKGELFISDYLTKNKVDFIPQYKIKKCRDNQPLPFDFKIIANGELKLIEFDGSQHFGNSRTIFDRKTIHIHDEMKNKYCESNGIKLLRIPYWWLRNDRITRELDKFCLNK